MQYAIVGGEDGSSNITVFVPGTDPQVAHSSHPNYDKIVAGAIAGDDSVVGLFDIAKTAIDKFERLGDRVTTANGALFLDGDEIHNVLTEQVVRFVKEGVDDWKPLVKFLENVLNNPNEHSREQLYGWLSSKAFTITDEGFILGYKGVETDGNGGYQSGFTGTAIVDGVVVTGHIPNKIGSIVEMPRHDVVHDPHVACHTGLHVGTYDYARHYARAAMLEVHVNPRDVVSVPTDAGEEKMRVCRYTVVGTLDAPVCEAVVFGYFDGEDEEDEDVERGSFFNNDAHLEDTPEEPVADLVDHGTVGVGDEFKNTDARRSGTTFKVESIEGDHAVGKSLPANITRKVRLDRLTSYRYKKV